MKKILCLASALIFCISFVVFAQENSLENTIKDKLIVGIESNSGKKNIENLNVLQVGEVDSSDASLVLKTDDIKVNQYLTTIGYKISDNLIPYAILGYSRINLNQSLGLDGIDLASNEMREGAFTYGLGASGELVEIEGITFGYDARYLMANTEEDRNIDIIDIGELNDNQKLDYGELDLSLIASKEIAIGNKIIQSITPYIGYQFSRVDLKKKDNVTIDSSLAIGTEMNLTGNTNSALVGVGVKVNENWSASVGAVINDNIGIMTKVIYKF